MKDYEEVRARAAKLIKLVLMGGAHFGLHGLHFGDKCSAVCARLFQAEREHVKANYKARVSRVRGIDTVVEFAAVVHYLSRSSRVMKASQVMFETESLLVPIVAVSPYIKREIPIERELAAYIGIAGTHFQAKTAKDASVAARCA